MREAMLLHTSLDIAYSLVRADGESRMQVQKPGKETCNNSARTTNGREEHLPGL